MGLGIQVKVGGMTADAELAGASFVEVHERMGEPTTYRLRYLVDIGEGDLPLLSDARFAPGAELSVVVPIDNQDQVLVHGPVHGHRIRLIHGGTGSWVEVVGSDRSIEMDREVKSKVWDTGSATDAVQTILGGYGFTPDVEATKEQYSDKKHTLVQRDTDLRFIRRLARRYGHLFWLTTDAAGTHTAHFRRPPVDGASTASLIINRENPTMASLDISFDVERPTSAVAVQLNLNDKQDVAGDVARSPIKPLGTSDLAAIASQVRTVHVTAPVDESSDLTARSEAALIEAGWFIRASCDASLNTLGKLVRSHTVIDIQGAGKLHSGNYFVCGVRHVIDATSHVMELELLRNAWGV
ncbi:phage late control D family protein [Sorangium sp. So ce1097]|uniref:phage late control D family protein n=1 Tax=Sorangium sp. So ce1097 TaxID=3133330 RepID=UPI003F607BD1